MRRHTGSRSKPGRRGLKLVNDVRRVKGYVGKHRKQGARNVLTGLGVGALLAGLFFLMLEYPYTTALVVLMYVVMAIPALVVT